MSGNFGLPPSTISFNAQVYEENPSSTAKKTKEDSVVTTHFKNSMNKNLELDKLGTASGLKKFGTMLVAPLAGYTMAMKAIDFKYPLHKILPIFAPIAFFAGAIGGVAYAAKFLKAHEIDKGIKDHHLDDTKGKSIVTSTVTEDPDEEIGIPDESETFSDLSDSSKTSARDPNAIYVVNSDDEDDDYQSTLPKGLPTEDSDEEPGLEDDSAPLPKGLPVLEPETIDIPVQNKNDKQEIQARLDKLSLSFRQVIDTPSGQSEEQKLEKSKKLDSLKDEITELVITLKNNHPNISKKSTDPTNGKILETLKSIKNSAKDSLNFPLVNEIHQVDGTQVKETWILASLENLEDIFKRTDVAAGSKSKSPGHPVHSTTNFIDSNQYFLENVKSKEIKDSLKRLHNIAIERNELPLANKIAPLINKKQHASTSAPLKASNLSKSPQEIHLIKEELTALWDQLDTCVKQYTEEYENPIREEGILATIRDKIEALMVRVNSPVIQNHRGISKEVDAELDQITQTLKTIISKAYEKNDTALLKTIHQIGNTLFNDENIQS